MGRWTTTWILAASAAVAASLPQPMVGALSPPPPTHEERADAQELVAPDTVRDPELDPAFEQLLRELGREPAPCIDHVTPDD